MNQAPTKEWGQCHGVRPSHREMSLSCLLPWGQAFSPGNVPFIPFALKAFSWIRPDSDMILEKLAVAGVSLNKRLAFLRIFRSQGRIPQAVVKVGEKEITKRKVFLIRF